MVVLCRKAKAVELMLVDALLAADPVLKMTERIHDPREFVKMDDTLLKQVEQYGLLHPHWESSEEAGPIAAAQTIITRYLVGLEDLLHARWAHCCCSEHQHQVASRTFLV